MTCRTETAGDREYRFCAEDPPREAARVQSVFRARLVDEITGAPPRSGVRIVTGHAGLYPRVTSDGFVGLVGRQAEPGRTVDVLIEAEGYVPWRARAPLSSPGWTEVELHRAAVVIRGRVSRYEAGRLSPVADSTVRIGGVWATFPPADASVAASPPNLVSISPGIYRSRSAGAGSIRRFDLTPAPPAEHKRLLAPAVAGSNELLLSDREGLAPGDVLVVDLSDPDRTEYVPIDDIQGASTPAQPARVYLSFELAFAHAVQAVAARVEPGETGAVHALWRDAAPGDQVVFPSAMDDLDGGATVSISGDGPEEYHLVRLYQTTSDGEGWFRLPPVSRVAQMTLIVEPPDAAAALERLLSPQYGSPEHRADLVFPAANGS